MGVRLCYDEDRAYRCVRLNLVDGRIFEQPLERRDSEVMLSITCGDEYTLAFGELGVGNEVKELGSVSNTIMTRDPEIGAPFTGMMIGVFAFGEMEAALEPADFEYAEIIGH
jgi:hypothetical protein